MTLISVQYSLLACLCVFIFKNHSAGFVQERVHSTTIGVDATATFLRQLLQELEGAAAEYLVLGRETLEHAHEVELGSLLTAASMVRMLPRLTLILRHHTLH